MVAVIVIATLQEQAVALATGKLKVVVVVNQQYPPTKMTNVALAVAYDGAGFRGWTDVRDSALRPALSRLLRQDDM